MDGTKLYPPIPLNQVSHIFTHSNSHQNTLADALSFQTGKKVRGHVLLLNSFADH